jgi:hypothetical protein
LLLSTRIIWKKRDYMTQLLYKNEEKRSSRGACRREVEEEASSCYYKSMGEGQAPKLIMGEETSSALATNGWGRGELLELINRGRGELSSCYKLMGEGELLELINGGENELSSCYKSMGEEASSSPDKNWCGGRRTQFLCCAGSTSTSATPTWRRAPLPLLT